MPAFARISKLKKVKMTREEAQAAARQAMAERAEARINANKGGP